MGERIVRMQENKTRFTKALLMNLPLLLNQFLIQTNCSLFTYGENPRYFECK